MLTYAKCSNNKLNFATKIDRIRKKPTKILAISFVRNIWSTSLILRKVSDRISRKNKRDTLVILTASFASKSSQSLQNQALFSISLLGSKILHFVTK